VRREGSLPRAGEGAAIADAKRLRTSTQVETKAVFMFAGRGWNETEAGAENGAIGASAEIPDLSILGFYIPQRMKAAYSLEVTRLEWHEDAITTGLAVETDVIFVLCPESAWRWGPCWPMSRVSEGRREFVVLIQVRLCPREAGSRCVRGSNHASSACHEKAKDDELRESAPTRTASGHRPPWL
jgi:hypothetical protein